MSEKEGKELVNALTERVTLNIFRVGCDRVNFNILKRLPTSVQKLKEMTELSKMPLNRRLNELERVGLVKRERYEGEILPTTLTKEFSTMIEDLKLDVIKELPNLI